MLGRLLYVPERGKTAVTAEHIAGLPLLRGTLYVPEGLAGWRLSRRIGKLKRLLAERGVRQLVIPEDFPFAGAFYEFGRVDPLPFYRSIADLLALERLRLSGLEPGQSVVALSAPRLSPELTAAAGELRPLVRGLLIDVPGEGGRYAQWLHREYGLPVGLPERADVTVAFGPGAGRWGKVLKLWEGNLSLCGMEVSTPGLEFPAGCEEQLLAALWERGILDRNALRIVRKAP